MAPSGGSRSPGSESPESRSGSPRSRARAHLTAGSLSAGSIAAAVCFLVALLLAVAGRPAARGPALDPIATAAGMVALDAQAWASAGVLLLLGTPVAGVLATVVEYLKTSPAAESRYAIVALAVLLVLSVSLAVALVR
jgi:hypothetical protein